MTAHTRYNLYYIFLEDRAAHPPPEAEKQEVLKILKKIFKNVKPNEFSNPPIVRNPKKHKQKGESL